MTHSTNPISHINILKVVGDEYYSFYIPSGHPNKVIRVWEDPYSTTVDLLDIDDLPTHIRDKLTTPQEVLVFPPHEGLTTEEAKQLIKGLISGFTEPPADIPVLSIPHIVYDPGQREYYNTQSDIFLSDDDIEFHGLRPYDQITSPLPSPLPENYFTTKN